MWEGGKLKPGYGYGLAVVDNDLDPVAFARERPFDLGHGRAETGAFFRNDEREGEGIRRKFLGLTASMLHMKLYLLRQLPSKLLPELPAIPR